MRLENKMSNLNLEQIYLYASGYLLGDCINMGKTELQKLCLGSPGIDARALRTILKKKNGELFNITVCKELVDNYGDTKINFPAFEKLWQHIRERLDEFNHFSKGRSKLNQGQAPYQATRKHYSHLTFHYFMF